MLREREMDGQTLFENNKLFSEGNYRVIGGNPVKDDWDGPHDVRELIGQVQNASRKRRGAMSERQRHGGDSKSESRSALGAATALIAAHGGATVHKRASFVGTMSAALGASRTLQRMKQGEMDSLAP